MRMNMVWNIESITSERNEQAWLMILIVHYIPIQTPLFTKGFKTVSRFGVPTSSNSYVTRTEGF